MKRLLSLSLVVTTLLLTSCKSTDGVSDAKSQHVMMDEEFFEKVQVLMQHYPGIQKVTHVGGVFAMDFETVEGAGRIVEAFKRAETIALIKIVAFEGKKVVMQVARPAGRDMVAQMISQSRPECIAKTTVTKEGFLVTLKTLPPGSEETAFCRNILRGFFEVKKEEGNNILLGYLSKPFVCHTEDQRITVETYKDFSVDDGRAIMDMASFAVVKYPGGKTVKLETCDVEMLNDGNEPTGMTISCENPDEKVKHEFKMGAGFGFVTTLTEGDNVQQTRCMFPGMIGGGEGSSSSQPSH
ncbi:MAG: hypothetical protein AB7T49_17520 [Oligoflexales bacterium]